MATGPVKITSTAEAKALSDSAKLLITQDGEGDESGTKVLRQAALSAIATKLRSIFDNNKAYVTPEEIRKMFPELVKSVEIEEGKICITYWNDEYVEHEIATSSDVGGVGFTSWEYDRDTGYLHIYDDDKLDVLDPVFIGGGSSGSATGSKITFSILSGGTMTAPEDSEAVMVRLLFRSIDAESEIATGAGTLQIFKDGIIQKTMVLQQGETEVDIKGYLSTGANTLSFVLTDAYGGSATRPLKVTVESLRLDWNLESSMRNTGDLIVYLTPHGNGNKTVYLIVDGEEYSADTVTTNGRRISKTISGLEHGAHTIEAYTELNVEGSALRSNRLVSAVAQIAPGNSTPVVAGHVSAKTVAQYTTVSVTHRVIDPENNPTGVTYMVNGITYATQIVSQGEQVWDYRPSSTGTVRLSILCGTTMWEEEIEVTAIGASISEVTTNLECKIDPTTIPDLEAWAFGDYRLELSEGFDMVNGGLVNDDEGVRCIRITAGDRLTLNYPMFSGDARRAGLSAKFIYAIRNSSKKDAIGISCMSGGIGFEARANNVYLRGNQTTLTLSTCEDMKTELDFNIQPDTSDRLMYIWESASTFSYAKYATDENFTQADGQYITFGCDDADVYLYMVRAYSRDLTDAELKANFVADGKDGPDILARHDRNEIYDSAGNIDIEIAAEKNPNAHFIVIDAARLTEGKKDLVTGAIRHIYGAGGAPHRFTAHNVGMVVQGTSSVEHAKTAGPNIKFTLNDGIVLEDGTRKTGYAMNGEDHSVPITILNWKKNIASEDHIVNMMCAEWYNRYQPTPRQAIEDDPRVRDCLEGVMCAVFFHNTGTEAVQVGPDMVQPDETVFFGLGNLCTDKDAADAFAYDPIVIEVKNNTEPQVRFKTAEGVKVDGGNFEFRYLDKEQYSEAEAEALFQELAEWICACDFTQATDEALPRVEVFNGRAFSADTEEYRKAKWNAELSSHIDVAGLCWHHNHTLFHLLRDNRAKNMFWSYNPLTGVWCLRFNWDNDTGHCRNNDGYIDIEPGYLDYDTLGTGDVFNGADNVVFVNLRECNFADLRAAYIDRESAGAWNVDELYGYAKRNQEYFCEALWIEDAQHNAIRTMQNLGTDDYLARATGRLRLHLKKSLTFQKVLVDSYYTSTASTADSSAFRGYTPSNYAGVAPSGIVKITPYTDMFINILAGSTAFRERAYAGQEITIDISAELNNTEMYIRDAQWIADLGDLSALYLGQFEASKLRRVKRLLIGSSVEGYYNTNFTTASFENCAKLEEVNMGGLVNAKRAFDFSRNIYLRKLYTKGSGVTGLTFARNGRLEEALLNGVASLTMIGLFKLRDFEMDDFRALTSLTIERCPNVDSYGIAAAAVNLSRVRLLDVDWKVRIDAYDVIMRLHNISGIDDDNYNTEHGVLTGAAYFATMTARKYASLLETVPSIEVTYGNLLEEHVVTFQLPDGTVLYTDGTEHGGSVRDPIDAGVIAVPTMPPDVENVYSFWKWDIPFNYIMQDMVVTAMFTSTPRQYTVSYVVEGIVKETHTVNAHGSCTYEGEDPVSTGQLFAGWESAATDVVSDLTINAIFISPVLPAYKKDLSGYDFAYSDVDGDNAAYTKAEFAGILMSGMAKEYFAVGDRMKMAIENHAAVADSTIIFSLHAFNHYRLAEGNGFAGTTWFMIGLLNANRQMNSTNTNVGGWPATAMRKFLNENLYPTLTPYWRSLIKLVQIRSSKGGTQPEIVTSNDRLYLMSQAEVGFDTNAVPYRDEIDPDAENKTFALYTNNTTRIKRPYNNEGTAASWWLRSPWASNTTYFAYVYTSGSSNNINASGSNGVCVGLSI